MAILPYSLRLKRPIKYNNTDPFASFIKGRNIMEWVLSLHDILHDTKMRKKGGLILKLYFEMAYDKLNWDEV